MRPHLFKGSLAALAVLSAVACAPDGSPTGPQLSLVDGLAPSLTELENKAKLAVCKVGLDQPTLGQGFDFTASATSGLFISEFTAFAVGAEDVFDNTNCVWVWRDETGDPDVEVTVTELVPDGFVLESAAVHAGGAWADLQIVDGSVTVNPALGETTRVVFRNKTDFEPAFGRMTGGGFQIRVDDVRVTRGLTLHCDITLSNNLEINWPGGNNWHLEKESLESVSCIDDPAYNPWPPAAPFDTFIATAFGSLNGVDGSIIEFKFIDDGEPGRTDEAHFTIYAAGQGPGQVAPGAEVVVLEVSGQLDGGNLQAHYDQPHS